MKELLSATLKTAGFEVADFGAYEMVAGDDYPDFVAPLTGHALSLDLVQTFLNAHFKGAERVRLAKAAHNQHRQTGENRAEARENVLYANDPE